jgi:hypothetical protein
MFQLNYDSTLALELKNMCDTRKHHHYCRVLLALEDDVVFLKTLRILYTYHWCILPSTRMWCSSSPPLRKLLTYYRWVLPALHKDVPSPPNDGGVSVNMCG